MGQYTPMEKMDRLYTPKGGIRIKFDINNATGLGRMLIATIPRPEINEWNDMVGELRRGTK